MYRCINLDPNSIEIVVFLIEILSTPGDTMLSITPNCLVRVKGVKVGIQQSMSYHLPAGSYQ